jgi:hypothetical protein
MKHSSSRLLCWGATVVLTLAFGRLSFSAVDPWLAAEKELSTKIYTVTGPKAVAVSFVNRSSMSQKDAEQLDQAISAQMASLGIQIVPPEKASSTLRITLSEDIANYVVVVEVQTGAPAGRVFIVSCPKNEAAGLDGSTLPVVLRRTFVWSQQQPILDAVLFEDNAGGSHLLVLEPEAVTAYRFETGHWQPDQTLAIRHEGPWPRDLRGRIIFHPDQQFDVYLPGVTCAGSREPPPAMSCRASDDPWPLSPDGTFRAFFSPARNFFTGVLSPGIGKVSSTVTFFSAAPVPRLTSALWLFAGVDGTVHVLDGTTDQPAYWEWGSDIASIQTSCGAGTQVLVTQKENDRLDSVRAYELGDRDPVLMSSPLEFSGPITALWTEYRKDSAIAVSHNTRTGMYEAFRVFASCGQ